MRLSFLILLGSLTLFAQTPYAPMGRTAYTTSSFGENRGTRYHAGIDFATQMEEGWPVLAPGDGMVEFVATSPFGYGKHLRFRAADSTVWVFAHLSGFVPRLDSIVENLRTTKQKNNVSAEPMLAFKTGDTLAYSGSTGIGNPHLHVERRFKNATDYRNPCQAGLVCTDTLAPSLFGLAIWNKKAIVLNGSKALDAGCARLPANPPRHAEASLALKIADYSRAPLENPMSIYRLEAKQNGKTLYRKQHDSLLVANMLNVRDELLWSEEADTAGDWHQFKVKMDTQLPLELEVEDFAGHTTRKTLAFSKQCPMDTLPPVRKLQDSLLFTFLARPWISLAQCGQGKWELRQDLDGKRKRIAKDLCKETKYLRVEHGMAPLSAVVERFPAANRLAWIVGKDTLRDIGLQLIGKGKDSIVTAPGLTQKFTGVGRTAWTQVAAWQHLPADSSLPARWEFHPKGLQVYGTWELCIDSLQAPQPLYWLGETSRQWFIFSKQEMRASKRCVQINELRDIASLSDTEAPTAGQPYPGTLMAYGQWVPSLRVPLKDDLSGPDFGCLSARDASGKWIPLDYDSEPKELVFNRAQLPAPGQKITLNLCDEAGNKRQSVMQIP